MAYKSQVTNKYLGAGFKGAPKSNRNLASTELGQIVTALQNDLTPAVAGWATANIEGLQDAAEKKMQKLYASGKDSKTINAEILAGKHPDLEHKYTEAVVEGQIGRIEAYETINKITSEIGNYKPREQTLESFWQGYTPNFDERGKFYTEGFAVVFNEYKAKALTKDAEERAIYQENQKINGIVSSLKGEYELNGFEEGKAWQLVESFGSPLPFSGKEKNYFVNNAAKNKAMFLFIEDLVRTATTVEQLEHAELLLEEARGGKHKLGSLAETYNAEEVSKLRGSILSQKDAIETRNWNNLTRGKIIKETNFINDFFAYSNGGTLSDGTVVEKDGASPTQIMEYEKMAEETLNAMIDFDPSLAASVVQIKSNINELDRDQEQIDFIMSQIQKGVYIEDPNKMINDLANAGGNPSDMVSFMSAWTGAKNRKQNNLTLFPFQNDEFWKGSKKFVWDTLLVDTKLFDIENDEVKRRIIANTVLNEYAKRVDKWYSENPEPSKTLNNGTEWLEWNKNRKQFQFETEALILKTYKTEDYYKSIKAIMDKGDTNAISKIIASEVSNQTIDLVMESQIKATTDSLISQNQTVQNIIEDAQNQLLDIKDLSIIKERVNVIQQELKQSGINLSDDEVTQKLLEGLGINNTQIDFELIKNQIQGNIENLINEGFIKSMPELLNEKDKWWTINTDESLQVTPESLQRTTEFLNNVLGELTGLGLEFNPDVLTRLDPTFIDLIAKGLNVDNRTLRKTIQQLYNITLPQGE